MNLLVAQNPVAGLRFEIAVFDQILIPDRRQVKFLPTNRIVH